MIFQDLIRSVNYKQVFNIIYKNYYKKQNYSNTQMMDTDYAYSKVFDELSLKDCESSDEKLTISFEKVTKSFSKDLGDDSYIDVFLYDENDDERYGLDFMEWGKLLGSSIQNPLDMSNEEMCGHILWEMTFWGFGEEAINEQMQITLKSIDESESGEFEEINLDDLIK